jgi:hypothetical protein
LLFGIDQNHNFDRPFAQSQSPVSFIATNFARASIGDAQNNLRSTSLKRIERSSKMQSPLRPPLSFFLMLLLLALLGVGALGGGVFLIIDPTGAKMQWSLEALERSPFENYLIPGLLLLVVFGLGSFAVLLALIFRPAWSLAITLTRSTGEHWSWAAAFAIGLGQVIWIVAEVLMVNISSWLQPVCVTIGVLIMLLTLEPGLRRYLALNDRGASGSRISLH